MFNNLNLDREALWLTDHAHLSYSAFGQAFLESSQVTFASLYMVAELSEATARTIVGRGLFSAWLIGDIEQF